MARMERYSADELKILAVYVKENPGVAVADLAVGATTVLPGRTADALKQRIFKMQREATASKKPRAVAVKKAAKVAVPKVVAKVGAKLGVRKPAAPARKPAPRKESTIRTMPVHPPQPAAADAVEVPNELLLTLPNGAKITGTPFQLAQLVRSL